MGTAQLAPQCSLLLAAPIHALLRCAATFKMGRLDK
jgi:hypothetical protein